MYDPTAPEPHLTAVALTIAHLQDDQEAAAALVASLDRTELEQVAHALAEWSVNDHADDPVGFRDLLVETTLALNEQSNRT